MIRVASAAVLGALLFVTIWWLPWWATMALAAVAAALAAAEVAGLATAAGAPVAPGPVAVASAAAAIAFSMHDGSSTSLGGDALPPLMLGIAFGAGVAALASGPPSKVMLTRAAVMMMAPWYVGLPVGALAWIARAGGREAITWLILVIAASDSAQYYTGRAFGRRKLAPSVSPAKTIEGALGGLVGAAIVATVAGAWWLPAVSRPLVAALGIALAVAGMTGDLFESLLKRSAGVKDSSTLIPGHGGVLDRLDSYLFAAPVFYMFMRYVA